MNKIDKRIDRMQSDLPCDLNFNVYDRLDILSLKLDAHRKETAERFEEVGERFDRLESRFDALEARFDNLEARFDNLESRFIKLEAEVRDMPGRIMDELANMLWPHLSHNDIKHLEHDKRLNALETKANFSRRIFYYSMH
jgi:predicted  nucleic acid-binding Zn-ribbon protein